MTACTSRRQRWSGLEAKIAVPPPAVYMRSTTLAAVAVACVAAIRSSPRCSAFTGVPAWTNSHTPVVSSTKRARAERAMAIASQSAICVVVRVDKEPLVSRRTFLFSALPKAT